MTSKRIFAALLASLLLLPALVSCSDNAQDTPGTSAPADTTTADTTTRETERHEVFAKGTRYCFLHMMNI